MAARKIVLALPALRRPQLPRQQAEQPQQVERQPEQQTNDNLGSATDVEEITRLEYRRSLAHLGYLIRIEEEEEDIEPNVRRAIQNMEKDAKNRRLFKD